MEEIKCNQVATLRGGKWEKTYEESRRVYRIDGLSPTVHTQGGGNQEIKILVEPLAFDEQNAYLIEDGIVGILTTDGSSPKHNNRVVEPLVYDGFNQQIKADSSTSGTITRNVGADLKRNGKGIIEPCCATIRGRNSKGGEYVQNLEINLGGTTNSLTTVQKDNMVLEPSKINYRVRKLTEKECFRLQGVKDEDFAKIRKNQSKSSCYHLAGDSITTSVLMALFGEMLEIDWGEKVNKLIEELKDK